MYHYINIKLRKTHRISLEMRQTQVYEVRSGNGRTRLDPRIQPQFDLQNIASRNMHTFDNMNSP